jgi:hypothetical protein
MRRKEFAMTVWIALTALLFIGLTLAPFVAESADHGAALNLRR